MTTPLRILVTAAFDPQTGTALSTIHDTTITNDPETGRSLADRALTDPEVAAALPAAQVIVAELDRIDAATLAAAPLLELVIACRANPANVDLAACEAAGVRVTTTPGRNAEVTADFTLALILATVRHLSESERWLRSGAWDPADVFAPYAKFQGIGLRGRLLGVIGGGAVGRRVISRARAFGMEVVVHDPFLATGALGDDIPLVALDELLATADVVTLHVALSTDTENLIGARELALLKPDAYLVNAGRAALVDGDALRQTLREGRIAGAGFDVFHHEPLDPADELLAFENVTLTPHIAGASADVVTEHSRMAVDTITVYALQE